LDNAISYSINDGKITVILEELPKFIKYSVSDQGIGISKEDAKRIFSKFFRAESIYKYQTQGLGLRLYLAKAIIEASAGKIGFKSQKDKGSTFCFTLPIAHVESSSM
jgi:two-component system sensor histidine kinase VicK